MTLNDLTHGQVALIESISTDGSLTQDGFKVRLEAMGLVAGKPVCVMRSALLGGPLQVRVGSTTEIAIRRHEAERVFVVSRLLNPLES